MQWSSFRIYINIYSTTKQLNKAKAKELYKQLFTTIPIKSYS